METPICRFRQIVANIEARQKIRRMYDNTISEWQVRTLAQIIAATVPVEKGRKNQLADAAAKIRLRLEDDGGKAENDAPPEVFIEQGSQTAVNAPGSYERLMSGFSAGPR